MARPGLPLPLGGLEAQELEVGTHEEEAAEAHEERDDGEAGEGEAVGGARQRDGEGGGREAHLCGEDLVLHELDLVELGGLEDDLLLLLLLPLLGHPGFQRARAF